MFFYPARYRVCQNSRVVCLEKKHKLTHTHTHTVHQHNINLPSVCHHSGCLANPSLVFKALFSPQTGAKTSQLNISKRRMHL